MPDYVTVEVDIAADGSITADPNPVFVASGQTLMFHVNSNASEATTLSVDWPDGPESPFGVTGHSESAARRCQGIGAPVEWPPEVGNATVTLSAHGSPVLGTLAVDVYRSAEPAMMLGPVSSLPHREPILGGPPNITHNYYFSGTAQDDFHELESDWQTEAHWVDIANTDKCYRYKVTNKGPAEVTVKALPSGKQTHIKAGSSAYVECSRIQVKTRSAAGHAHGDIDVA